jgi:predicted MFS family arabinose efflux permease
VPALLPHLPIYGLIFTQGTVWTAFFALAPSYRDGLDLSRFELGAVSASFGVATVLSGLPLGALADRVEARAVTIASGILLTLASLGHALAFDFWSLLVARSTYAVAVVLIWAAATTWLGQRLEPARRSAALAAMWPVLGIGTLVGPVFAASLVDRYGFRIPFLAIGAVALAITAVFAATTEAQAPSRAAPQRARGLLRALQTEPLLAGAVVIMVVGPIAETVLSLLGPIQLDENGESALFIGVVFAVASGAFVLMGAVVTHAAQRVVTLGVAATSLLLLAIPFAALVLADSTALLVAALVLRMALIGVLYSISFALGVLGADRAGIGRGTVAGLIMLASGVANIVGPFVAGAFAQASGEEAAYAVVALTCCVCAAWLATRSRLQPSPAAPAGS